MQTAVSPESLDVIVGDSDCLGGMSLADPAAIESAAEGRLRGSGEARTDGARDAGSSSAALGANVAICSMHIERASLFT
jgi:hypothetical protein